MFQFGATGTVQQQQEFFQELLPFLDGLDCVTQYAYFMDEVGVLVNADGSLSALGQTYISV